MRNPTWVRDEVILAMDLYLRTGRKQLSKGHPDVICLSQLLNALPLHHADQREESFRNPTGIEMILGNFLGIDPDQPQVGLGRNNHLQREVWDDFVDRLPALAEAAFVRATRLNDLAIVCTNCHRMLHRGNPRLTVDALRELLFNRRVVGNSSPELSHATADLS